MYRRTMDEEEGHCINEIRWAALDDHCDYFWTRDINFYFFPKTARG